MAKAQRQSAFFSLAAVCLLLCSGPLMGQTRQIGSRLELFVDDWLIGSTNGVQLELKKPVDAGKVLDFDQPWEGSFTIATHVIKVGDKYRMYYRALPRVNRPDLESYSVAESVDGIHWTKPELGIIEFEGSKKNNITYSGGNFIFFEDGNPNEPAQRRYKGLRYVKRSPDNAVGLVSMVSPDGLHWTQWSDGWVITGGPLDGQHTALWDPQRKEYLTFTRNWVDTNKGFGLPPDLDAPPSEYHSWYVQSNRFRSITTATSTDFQNWTDQEWIIYDPTTPYEHLCTNGVSQYFRGPHMYVGMPMRFKFKDGQPNDVIFMSSRDGVNWDRRFTEAFLELDPAEGLGNHGDMIIGPGMVQTGPDEMSIYYTSHYGQDDVHMRRVTLRLDGFASVNADGGGGEFTTKPLTFSREQLVINYVTSAGGSVKVEIQDASGNPLPGFGLADSQIISGDEIERVVGWTNGSDVSALEGQSVRLRFVMQDADLYSIQFVPEPTTMGLLGVGGLESCCVAGAYSP